MCDVEDLAVKSGVLLIQIAAANAVPVIIQRRALAKLRPPLSMRQRRRVSYIWLSHDAHLGTHANSPLLPAALQGDDRCTERTSANHFLANGED